MDKKTFALNAIRPYAKDPKTCGYNGVACVYITNDGRKCVAGRFMLVPEDWSGNNAGIASILHDYAQGEVFREEAVGILAKSEWEALQRIHDQIAQFESEHVIRHYVKELGLFTYEEMMAD